MADIETVNWVQSDREWSPNRTRLSDEKWRRRPSQSGINKDQIAAHESYDHCLDEFTFTRGVVMQLYAYEMRIGRKFD